MSNCTANKSIFGYAAIGLIVLGLIVITNGCTKSEKNQSTDNSLNPKTVVDYFGTLKVSGNKIMDKNNNIIVLRGMSLFWSQWGGSFYNENCIKWLRDDWKCTVIRAAMGIENGGYLTNQQLEYNKLTTVIDAAIKYGIYVIVDWHDHNAHEHIPQAKSFFSSIAQKYGNYPNIIYEIYNEPLQVSWNLVVKPYSIEIINAIRQYDQNNLIIVGSPNWSQDVDIAAKDPINAENIAYSFHFYTSTHTQSLRNKAIAAMNAGIPLFVAEFGISESNGTGKPNYLETNHWFNFLEIYNLSCCNWAISDKDESAAALKFGADYTGNWKLENITESGIFNRNYIITKNNPLFEKLKE